jgi:3-phenylpropionate/trans-cinnamate dioxygenase ferredoxin component
MSADTIPTEFRTLDDGARLPDNYVNPYYLQDLKRRVAVARVGGKLFAFDDLYEGCPLSGGLLTGTTLMSQCDGSQFEVTSGAVRLGYQRLRSPTILRAEEAAIDEGVPVPVLTTALYERFSSRGEADYQDKLLSAMRYGFGGHLEKSAK